MDDNQNQPQPDVQEPAACNKIAMGASCDPCGYPYSEAMFDGDSLGPCDKAPVDINDGYATNFDPRIETCPCMSCRSDMAYIHPCLLA